MAHQARPNSDPDRRRNETSASSRAQAPAFAGYRSQCLDCWLQEVCCLCRSRAGEIRCHNCRAKRKPLSLSSQRRKLALLKKLGYDGFKCLLCGETDLRVFESHHIAGQANSTLQGPLCLNCHAIQSDLQEDTLGTLRRQDPDRRPLELQAAFEFGLAAFLVVYAAAGDLEAEARVFFTAVVVVLVAWAVWNLAADKHFVATLGSDYSRGVSVPPPP